MTTTVSRLPSKWLAVALLTLVTPLATEGQRRGPRQPTAASWPSIMVGVEPMKSLQAIPVGRLQWQHRPEEQNWSGW